VIFSRFIQMAGCIALTVFGSGCEDATMRSSSMSPSVVPGEKLTIDYSAYAVSRPERWDMVAFTPPGQTNQTWVFRVIALPGERVDFASNGVQANGRMLELPAGLTNIAYVSPAEMGQPSAIDFPYVVPSSSYFLLGDNSRNANDSRFIGAIPMTNILGRVVGK